MYQCALITGASSGIGKEMALLLQNNCKRMILVARRKDRLIQLKERLSCKCEIIVKDLGDRTQCRELCEQIKDYPIDLLINNAGFGDCGHFLDTDLDKELGMIDLNITAMHILLKQVLLIMNKQKKGAILNVASSAGLLPAGPYMSTYYATKSYVVSLTRGIAQELKEQHSPVYIGCLCPGPVDTEFNSVANCEFALKGITARDCAKAALNGIKKRAIVIVPSFRMKCAINLCGFVPDPVLVKIASHQQKKKIYH